MHQGGLQGCTVNIADFGLFLHHIGSDSNPGMTLEEPSRLCDHDVLHSCLYQSKEKNVIRPDFGRSYRHLSFSKQPMKTGYSTHLCYIIPSLPHPVSTGYFRNRYRGKALFLILVRVHDIHFTRLTRISRQICPILILPN